MVYSLYPFARSYGRPLYIVELLPLSKLERPQSKHSVEAAVISVQRQPVDHAYRH